MTALSFRADAGKVAASGSRMMVGPTRWTTSQDRAPCEDYLALHPFFASSQTCYDALILWRSHHVGGLCCDVIA